MEKYKTIPISFSVCRKDDNPIYGISSTHISLEDDAAGPYIKISQSKNEANPGETVFDFDEFDEIVKAVDSLKLIAKDIEK